MMSDDVGSSFLISLVRSEMVPAVGSATDNVFERLDLVFTALFTVELSIRQSLDSFLK
jgi:hypothetical protein